MRNLIAPALMIAALHFIITFLLGFATGIGTLRGFWLVLQNILTFPLSLFSGPDNPLLGWTGWIVLSLIWGFAIAYLIKRLG